ncbi:MAG: diguanylate cyclase [Chromatiaceae bacterium]|nr:diguanylate cyclase [Chromatiaceae bacterium]
MDPLSPGPEPAGPSAAQAQAELARLGVEVETMQAVLVRLLQDVVDAEARLVDTHAAQLVEANERLVLAALTSHDQAQAAVRALAEAEHSAALDALTRLPNRTTLLDRFAQALAQARRHGTRLGLLFVDLDDFKRLNDAYGHAFGDEVLRQVAERLVSAVREADTVSRYGGDEFLILLAELSQPADAQAVAEKLGAALSAPIELAGQVVRLTASLGAALYPDDGEDIDTLIARADAAMYQAKRSRAGSAAGQGAAAGPAPSALPEPTPARTNQAVDPERRLADLREANEKLVLAALSALELKEAAELARQRQRAFLAAVTDELSNPLAPIRIATTMLGRLPGEEALLSRVQQVIERQMAHMARLVGHLVDASATEGGGLVPERAWVDLAEVIDAAVTIYRPTMDRLRLHLDWRRPPGALGVIGDAALLEQVVANLLDNACVHTPAGGRIGLSVAASADTLTLSVADDGIGIPARKLPEVFEPFMLDVHALDFNGVGLGIGLTVARALVRAHGGEIVAHSPGPRRGSEFVVTLPLAPGAPIAPAAGEDR